MVERAGLASLIGEERILWGADRAILRAWGADAATAVPVPVSPPARTEDDGLDDLPFEVATAD